MEYSEFNGTSSGNLSNSNNQYILEAEKEQQVADLTFADILFVLFVLTVMLVIFIKCTFPGFLYLIGRGPKVNIVCIILGFFWGLNILALFIAFINSEALNN